MRAQKTKRRALRKDRATAARHRRGQAGAQFARIYPYGEGEVVEVRLHGSRNAVSRRQRATLDALGLRKRGQVRSLAFHKPTTGGMFHVVDHLIAIRSLSPAPKSHENGSSNGAGAGRDAAVSVKTYKSGGGKSRLVRVKDAGLLRVEAQRSSFALMWPSPLGLREYFGVAKGLWWSDKGSVSLLADDADGVKEVPVSALPKQLSEGSWSFARVDFADRALTWAAKYEDPSRSGLKTEPGVKAAHEVSLSGTRFDPDYAAALIAATAVPPIADRTDRMIAKARETLGAYM